MTWRRYRDSREMNREDSMESGRTRGVQYQTSLQVPQTVDTETGGWGAKVYTPRGWVSATSHFGGLLSPQKHKSTR